MGQGGEISGGKMSAELLVKLREVPLLASLSSEQMACMEGADEVRLEAGEFILRQGEAAEFFWILLSGSLRLYQTMPDGVQVTVATAGPGTALGEVPLLANMVSVVEIAATEPCHLVRLSETGFWRLMTTCPEVRRVILGNMAKRFQRFQSMTIQQEKMASLGTLAAGLMHELNNPGAAARRAASQLRENLMRMHVLSAKFSRTPLSVEQKMCMCDLQDHVLGASARTAAMSSLEQSDAEEALAEWMEAAHVEGAWKLAPALVATGVDAATLECARTQFAGSTFSDALNWLEALVSSMQLVGTIEESIGRVSELVKAVKLYAYEGKGKMQAVDIWASIEATLVILGHKVREKQIVLEKVFTGDLPVLHTTVSGLNQVWTNILDNAIDAVEQGGWIGLRAWASDGTICVSIGDNGPGIPLESQAHIFDPFYTTKAPGVGTGMGLGIAHRIVEQHGGTLRFTSVPGETRFVVCLPAGEKPAVS